MRRAHSNVGWLVEEGSSIPFGFSLGYDFCAEHEHGAATIKEILGVPQVAFPIGVKDRTITQAPANMVLFEEYSLKSQDKRVKRTMPAAILVCYQGFSYRGVPESLTELVKGFDVSFYGDFARKTDLPNPEKHDIASSWSAHDGFAIHVRGLDNVQRLSELYKALKALKVSLADAQNFGFKRTGLSLVFNERMTEESKANVQAADEAHLRLHEAAAQSGIAALLKESNLKSYALVPKWTDGEGSGLLFYLNPYDQQKYASGWYTLSELQDWARGEGPVVDGISAEKEAKSIDVDYCPHLVRALNAEGVKMNRLPRFGWDSPARTALTVRLDIVTPGESGLNAGVYPAEALETYRLKGKAMHEAESQAYAEAKKMREQERLASVN